MKQQKILTAIITFVLVFSFSFFGRMTLHYFNAGNHSLDRQLVSIAQEINKSCPFMIDKYTRLDNVAVYPDKILVYNYTILQIPAQLKINELKQTIKPFILNNIKTSPDMEILRKKKVTFQFSYKNSKGEHLFFLKFPYSSYKN